MDHHQGKNVVGMDFATGVGHLRWVARLCFLACLLVAIISGRLLAAPYFGESFTYRQPDGEEFEVRLFGDEFFAYQETADGYLVIRDLQSGFFCYAKVTPDGAGMVSTGVRVGQAKPAGLDPKQRLGKGMAMMQSLGNRNRLGVDEKGRSNPGKKLVPANEGEIMNVPSDGTSTQPAPAPGDEADPGTPQPAPPSSTTLNNRVGLVLLASFPDRPGDVTKTVADIDNYCNAETYTTGGNATSIYGYFKIQSNGKLTYKNTVTAWFTAANPRSYYTDNTITYGARARDLIKEGLAALKAQGFDFTQCDGNNDGKLDGVNLFYAGARVNAWSEGLWPHQSGTSWTGLSGTGLTSTSFLYQITDMPATLTIGTFCHENGHMICDYPDLYSYDGNAANIGAFSLMATSGSTHPRHVDPYLKIHSGWADVVDLTSASHRLCAVQQDRNFFYRYRNPARSQEYFLFEVRGNAGYEGPWGGATSTNPANGLVVYHALETGSNTDSTIFTADAVTNYTKPYELLVVEATPNTASPWYDDPTPGTNDAFTSAGVSSVSDTTHPALKFWASDGRTVASSASVHSVSAAGMTMSFVIGAGAVPATPATEVTATQFTPNADYGSNAASQTFSVFNSGGGTLSYTVSDNAAWLACNVANGTATTEADLVTVSHTTNALAPGSYSATITVDGGAAGTKAIPVNLTIAPQPTLAVNPTSLLVAGTSGAPGVSASFSLVNTGGGTASYTLGKTQSWLTLDRSNGTVSTEQDMIFVTCDPLSIPPGTYNDTITITAAGATNSPISVPVTFVVDGADINLSTPNGGESWVRETTQAITWITAIGGNIKIDLYNNGVFFYTITASTPNDGSFDWSIPVFQPVGSMFRIRISSVETPATFDESFADFSILPEPAYTANMGTNPGWTLGTSWAYGQPTGAGQDGYGAPDPTSGATGSNVIGYRLDGDYEGSIGSTRWATTPAINCSNRSNVILSFRRWLGVEGPAYDHAYLEVSNNGTVWTPVWQNTGTVDDGAWQTLQYDISAVADGQATVFIRWGMGVTDSSWNYCGWNIDDVVVNGDLVGPSAGIVIAETDGSTAVAEGGATDTYSIALASQPSADVTIDIAPDSQVAVVPVSLTFTSANWATPQIVTVSAIDDAVIETTIHSGLITHGATSVDANYNGIFLNGLAVNVSDNDNNAPVVNAGSDQTIYLSGNSWSPLQLTPQLWLDAADDDMIILNGATVSQWNDKSGFARHATQATATAQPTATAAGLNGKRVLTFDGSTDVMNVNLDFLAGVSHSAFVVTKPTVYSNIYGAANPSAGANSLHVGFSNATTYRMNFWSNDFGPAVGASFHAGSANVLNFAWTTGVGKQIFANGTSQGTNTNAGNIGTMSGGGRIGRTTGHAFFGGDIAEFVAITGSLNQADRESMEGYLAHKWGITGWLPAGHPYKTDGPNNATAVATLDASATDDDSHPLTTLWTVVSGPAPVTFGDAGSIDTTATFTFPGVYTLHLTVSDGFTQVIDEVIITVNPDPSGIMDHFAISGVPSQAVVGTAINGITVTAQDAADQTVTSFTGTVTFGGTAGITGTSANFVAGVLAGLSITPAQEGADLTFTVDDGSGHIGEAVFTVLGLYDAWTTGPFANVLANTDPTADPDGDGLTNLQEYAFGTDPTVASGTISYVAGGSVTSPGGAIAINLAQGSGVDYRAVFSRRKDHATRGLNYAVQFSADLGSWVTSAATPTVLTDPGSPEEIEAVSVPYPFFIPVDGGFKKPTFFRVGTSINP